MTTTNIIFVVLILLLLLLLIGILIYTIIVFIIKIYVVIIIIIIINKIDNNTTIFIIIIKIYLRISHPFFTSIPLRSTDCIGTAVSPVYRVVIIVKIHCHCAHCVTKGDDYVWLVWCAKSYPPYIRAGCEEQEWLNIW